MKPAVLFEELKDQKVRCTACNHYCTIPIGGTGVCGIRKNVDGKLHLIPYGEAIALNIDPIEKKPLFHFLPGTLIFSLGTVGCNFACAFCQNWDISQAIRELKKQGKVPAQGIDTKQPWGDNWPPEKIVSMCTTKKIPSIAFTYTEPAIFFEYAYDTIQLATKSNIKSVFVSNGYTSKEALEKLNGKPDAFNIDLKSFSEKFYRETCKARLEPVLQTIETIAKRKQWLEITTLLIPGKNDSEKELQQIAEFIATQNPSIPWHVSAFHPDYQMLDHAPTTSEALETAVSIGKKAGLEFVYTGNISNGHENTICPACNSLLIERNYFVTRQNRIANGKCPDCNAIIPGVWQ